MYNTDTTLRSIHMVKSEPIENTYVIFTVQRMLYAPASTTDTSDLPT